MSRPGEQSSGALRKSAEESDRVSYVELFFDLGFAFAITRIAGVVTENPSLMTFAEGGIVTLAVWWAWIGTTWAMSWLDPAARSVLWLLFALTASGLAFSESIPQAFESRRFVFVGAYLAYCAIRTLGVIGCTRKRLPTIAAGQYRILAWTGFAALFWIAGAIVPDQRLRLVLWGVAVLIEYSTGWTRFWLPTAGRSSWEVWQIRGGHFAERAALFIMVVLGESILVVGMGLSGQTLTPGVVAAAICAFGNGVLFWFIYFAHGQDRGLRFITGRQSTGPVARLSYTYLHVFLVIGLVATTLGARLTLTHPFGDANPADGALLLLGPAIYLAGGFTFKRSIGVKTSIQAFQISGAIALVIVFVLLTMNAIAFDLLALAAMATGMLGLTVAGDELLWARRGRENAAIEEGEVSA